MTTADHKGTLVHVKPGEDNIRLHLVMSEGNFPGFCGRDNRTVNCRRRMYSLLRKFPKHVMLFSFFPFQLHGIL